MAILTYRSFLFTYVFICFLMRRESVVRFRCQNTMNLNSLGHCICVHQGNISAADGLIPDIPGVRVNQATNDLSWPHCILPVHFSAENLTLVWI